MSALEWKWDDAARGFQASGTAGDKYVVNRFSPPNDWKRATYEVYRVDPRGKRCYVGRAETFISKAQAIAQADNDRVKTAV